MRVRAYHGHSLPHGPHINLYQILFKIFVIEEMSAASIKHMCGISLMQAFHVCYYIGCAILFICIYSLISTFLNYFFILPVQKDRAFRTFYIKTLLLLMSFIKIKQYCVIARNGVVASLNVVWLDDAPTPLQQQLVDYFTCQATLKSVQNMLLTSSDKMYQCCVIVHDGAIASLNLVDDAPTPYRHKP